MSLLDDMVDPSNALVDRSIFYGAACAQCTGDARLQIVASTFFDEHVYGSVRSLPSLPLSEIEGVPLLFGSPEIERRGNHFIVQADIVASTYFMVTRYEEMVRHDVRDEHGRFPGRESLPYRAGFLHRPIVEEYAALLRQWLREVGMDVPAPERNFSMLLTHDVDAIRKYRRHWTQPLRTVAGVLLGRQSLANIPECFQTLVGGAQDPYANFADIIALDAGCSVPHRSVYFFMSGGDAPQDGAYDIHDADAQGILRQVVCSGAEVGLHTSYASGLRPDLVPAEKRALEEMLGQEVHANRHHYLTWREIEDGWVLSRAGIQWDATLGYADVAGFRLGVCHPIPLFDPIAMQLMGIEEHPLIVMDCTLDLPHYMGLDKQAALSYCCSLMDQVRRYGGEFVMLWHNTTLAASNDNYHRRLYRRLLAHAEGAGT